LFTTIEYQADIACELLSKEIDEMKQRKEKPLYHLEALSQGGLVARLMLITCP